MDDGGSSACSIILFLALLAIQAILTGFKKAIDLMNESEIIRRAEEELQQQKTAEAEEVQQAVTQIAAVEEELQQRAAEL